MKLQSGSRILDRLLQGGYEADVITTIYGPASAGKTTLCILACIGVCRRGKKIIYVDTEGGFSVERLRQIAPDYKKLLDRMLFLKPVSFEQQKAMFERLPGLIDERIGLVVVDTIGMLYRLELGKKEDIPSVNRNLGKQINFLSRISREKNVPVLLTNQVYSDFENKGKVNIVGGDLLRYSSKCMIELQSTNLGNRRAILRKHRSIEQEKEMTFKIVEGGIIGTKETKSPGQA